MSKKDWTAKQIIEHLPKRLKAFESMGFSTCIHFDIQGNRGGQFTLTIDGGEAKVVDGLIGAAKCIVSSIDEVYEEVEKGDKNAMLAIAKGEVKVSNMVEMISFTQRFYGLFSSKLKDNE